MNQKKPIPVRLSPDLIQRLDRAAARIGQNRACLIRFCVDSWLHDFEKYGYAVLPPNWPEIIKRQDGRRKKKLRGQP